MFELETDIMLSDCRVAQICAIFALPPELQCLRHDPSDEYTHLAYLKLFTPFKATSEKYTRLYTVSHSYQNMQWKALVIPLSHIVRSCHLVGVPIHGVG